MAAQKFSSVTQAPLQGSRRCQTALAICVTIIMIAARYGLVFRINESSAAFGMYGALVKVAAHTALTHTALRPLMLVIRLNCHMS